VLAGQRARRQRQECRSGSNQDPTEFYSNPSVGLQNCSLDGVPIGADRGPASEPNLQAASTSDPFHGWGPAWMPKHTATSAPAKVGIRPCGGNGKRDTPSAPSLSQTHCRAALLSAKSRAITESGAARPGHRQGAICFMNLGEIHASQDPLILAVKLPKAMSASGAVRTATEICVSESKRRNTRQRMGRLGSLVANGARPDSVPREGRFATARMTLPPIRSMDLSRRKP
jgi:hypothetical protein